jgi:hypothetical protein
MVLVTALSLAGCSESTAPTPQLELTVELDRASFAPPAPVAIRLTVRNRSVQTLRFSGSGSGTIWPEIQDADGQTLVELRGFTRDLQHWTLRPGDVVHHEVVWHGETLKPTNALVSPGAYAVVGHVTANELEARSDPVALVVRTP